MSREREGEREKESSLEKWKGPSSTGEYVELYDLLILTMSLPLHYYAEPFHFFHIKVCKCSAIISQTIQRPNRAIAKTLLTSNTHTQVHQGTPNCKPTPIPKFRSRTGLTPNRYEKSVCCTGRAARPIRCCVKQHGEGRECASSCLWQVSKQTVGSCLWQKVRSRCVGHDMKSRSRRWYCSQHIVLRGAA